MANRLETFDFTARRGRKAKYPWDEWMDGSIWEINSGKDFGKTIKTASVRAAAITEAKKRGKKIHTSAVNGRLVFQAYDLVS